MCEFFRELRGRPSCYVLRASVVNLSWMIGVCFLLLSACAGSKTALEEDFLQLTALEEKKRNLEQRYLWNLSHLEKFPTDKNLRLKQLEIKKEINLLIPEINKRRKEFDVALKEWEGRVIEGRLEKSFSDKNVRDNQRSDLPE